jgi:hypothetical protein
MKDFKVNAKVLVNFNDKTKVDMNGNLYMWEKDEIIKDMPRQRFEELSAKGLVTEDKTSFKEKENKKNKVEWE